MERRFQYYLPFTNHTEYIYTRPGPGSIIIIMMQKLILNYTRLHEYIHPQFMSMSTINYSCVRTRIYIEDKRTKKVIECAGSEQIVFS